MRGERLLAQARATSVYVTQREREAAHHAVRAALNEAMRRIKAFDKATNEKGSHQAYTNALMVLQEVRDQAE